MNTQRLADLLANARFRALSIAVLVLAILAVLQVNNLKKNEPMCELLSDCTMRSNELQKIQLALGQAGLTDFKVKDNRVYVPTSKRAEYLQAVAQNEAAPADLHNNEISPVSSNPFMTRTQQLAIERAKKQKKINDMVMHLPFVDQAWLEMDFAESRSAFHRASHSAVISIQPMDENGLTDQHVDTVKRMIGGAVAGLDPSQIVVIDLSVGFAHQDHVDPSASQQMHFKRIALEQKLEYETKIRDALQPYPGVTIGVEVKISASDEPRPVSSHASQMRPIRDALVVPASAQMGDTSTAGANGVASIDDFDSTPALVQTPILIAEAPKALPAKPFDPNAYSKEVTVAIDVPQHLVYELFGPATASRANSKSTEEYKAALAMDSRAKFEQLKSEIIAKIQPLIADTSYQNQASMPISVNLIRQPTDSMPAWLASTQAFAAQNWPSLAVLMIGLVLLSLVTRKDATTHSPSTDTDSVNSDILAFESHQADSDDHDVRLTQLIEKDPDAAAKVIESWIRDAA